MNETTRESKFLDAINRYAQQQKKLISDEVEEYKSKKIEQATEQGLQDAYDLIQRDVACKKSAIVTEKAAKEREMRLELFDLRSEITEEVFQKAKEKLIAFAQSEAYLTWILDSARELKNVFQDREILVFLSPADMNKAKSIKKILRNAEISEDKSIAIGGIKAVWKERGIVADDTLDAKLDEQRSWFIENCGLKVV